MGGRGRGRGQQHIRGKREVEGRRRREEVLVTRVWAADPDLGVWAGRCLYPRGRRPNPPRKPLCTERKHYHVRAHGPPPTPRP